MRCPHCSKEFEVGETARNNVASYQEGVVVKTSCCGKGVHVFPVNSIRVEKYTGNNDEDDWGAKLKK